MTKLVWRKKKRYFSTTSMLCDPLFWLSTIAQEANKVLKQSVIEILLNRQSDIILELPRKN